MTSFGTGTFSGTGGRALKMALAGFAALLLAACSSDPEQPVVQTTTQPTAAPSGPTPGTQQDLVVNVGDRVFFDTDQSSLRADARATLQRQAAWMNQYPDVRVNLEGHADERGTREYNLALGARRANSAKDYLVSLGVAPSRIQTISFGKERPVALCSDESCWAQNRRAVTIVTQGAGS
ncbi:peptidoglycan-associated lipoprotein Pal [Pyruvatibacter sp.]|uniref:peptidoglycan-associated lipoprotein Pal n=1 Tax=Pyruvatibacter sp. TaxID=1981328 RepID=UPI0032EEA2C4